VQLCASLHSLVLEDVSLMCWDDLRLLQISPLLLVVHARGIQGPETSPPSYGWSQREVLSRISPLHGFMRNMLWRRLNTPAMRDLQVVMLTPWWERDACS
jgi:hypothetical protein